MDLSALFHDGDLNGFIISKDKTLALYCSQVNGKNWKIIIPKIISFRAENFWEGNIICDIDVYSHLNCPADLIAYVHRYSELEKSKFLDARLREVSEKKLTLFHLTSSCGCELAALSAVSINEISCKPEAD